MNDGRPARIRGLDGLRALCILGVVWHHQGLSSFGWIGVQAFFVMSGYLITRILDQSRDESPGRFFADFYGRRALRIFPLYYGYLALLAAAIAAGMKAPGLTERMPYALAYGLDFFEANAPAETNSRMVSHFWSLAVEEQFYLVWPALFYFWPRQKLRPLFVAIVVMGPVVRWLTLHAALNPDRLPTSHLDAFAIGALAALFPLRLSRRTKLSLTVLGSVSGVASCASESLGYVIGFSLLNVASVCFVELLAAGEFAPAVFDHPVARYLGKISYGLYVLHFPIQSLLDKLHLPVLLRCAATMVLTVAAASLSYHQFESRLLALKDRWFPAREPLPPVLALPKAA